MADADLVVRGGAVVRPDAVDRADVAIVDGRIAGIGAGLPATGAEEIDATGLHVFPGGVDPHVHFNEPGRTDWEGIATGSEALAAGGFTTYADMP
ncbi:MAG TPA: amidohydrolase family protein, partial [Candidatus Dormibacteraeota bacterium]